MTRVFFMVMALLSAQASMAAPPKVDPAQLLQQAIQCELPNGKSTAVAKALASLSKKAGHGADNAMPITVFGLPGTEFSVDEDSEVYAVVFKNTKLEQVIAAARLKRDITDEFSRKGKTGLITASVADRTDVWLFCKVDQ